MAKYRAKSRRGVTVARRRAAKRPSGRQPSVDQQRRQRCQCQYQRTQSQPAHAGVAFDGLVTDLLLQRRVDALELGQARRVVRVSAGELGNLAQRPVVDGYRLPLAVELDEAVWGAERDGR